MESCPSRAHVQADRNWCRGEEGGPGLSDLTSASSHDVTYLLATRATPRTPVSRSSSVLGLCFCCCWWCGSVERRRQLPRRADHLVPPELLFSSWFQTTDTGHLEQSSSNFWLLLAFF